jgi:hypothetical protein
MLARTPLLTAVLTQTPAPTPTPPTASPTALPMWAIQSIDTAYVDWERRIGGLAHLRSLAQGRPGRDHIVRQQVGNHCLFGGRKGRGNPPESRFGSGGARSQRTAPSCAAPPLPDRYPNRLVGGLGRSQRGASRPR